MNPAFAAIAVAALGINVGWQPIDEGGVEYIIQIAPTELDRMTNLDDLISEVPKDLDVRRYRVTIGTGKLPRTTSKPTESVKEPPAKEVIAEGAIPSAAKEHQAAKAEMPVNVEEPATETTAKKPVTGTFAERDPAPKDEEDRFSPGSRQTDRPPTSNKRLLTEPADDSFTRLSKSSRYAEEDIADSDARRPPALTTPVRTAQNPTRASTNSFGRETNDNDSAWGPVVAIFFFLLLSMGANMWLGWIAWEARMRYQMLLEKYRAMGGKPAVEMV